MSQAAPRGHTCAPGHALEKADRNRELEALNSHSKCCQTVREGRMGGRRRGGREEEREEGRKEGGREGRGERERGGRRRGGHYITQL